MALLCRAVEATHDNHFQESLKLVNRALEAVWPNHPPAQAARQQLQRQGWVPALPAPGTAPAAAEQGVESQQPSGPSGSAASLTAAAPAAAAAAAQPAAAAAASTLAEVQAALRAELAQHCPGVSLTDLRQWALILRIYAACFAHGLGGITGQQYAQLLVDCQELLSTRGASGSLYPAVAAFSALSWAIQEAPLAAAVGWRQRDWVQRVAPLHAYGHLVQTRAEQAKGE